MTRSALLVAALLAGPAAADPPDPLDLARGLRDAGLADLALEYLDTPAAAGRPDLPLERALAKLAEADATTDDTVRDALVAGARADLNAFQRNPGRRGPEVATAAARADALAARGRLGRAARVRDDAGYKAAAAAARGPLTAAVRALGRAADKLDEQIRTETLPPAREQQLTRELARTRLDEALTQYQVTRSFVSPTAGEVDARAEAAKDARKLFEALAKADRFADLPVRAVARAWAVQCGVLLDERGAEKAFDEVKKDPSPAAAAGRRMARYFEIRLKVEDASRSGPAAQAAKAAAAAWLRDYDTARPTAEGLAVRYQLGLLKQREAAALVRDDPASKKSVVPPAAASLLRDADRDFRRLTETDNEYVDRATEKRADIARLFVGDADPDPSKLETFGDASMVAGVAFDKALRNPESGKLPKAVALYERAVALPAESPRDLADAKVRLAFAYLVSDRPAEAAALGEQVARSGAGGLSARAGSYAVRGYLAAAAKLPPDDPGRDAAQQKGIELAKFLDRTFPADPGTDDARVVLGQLLAKAGRSREAFDVLARVGPAHPRAAVARLMQGAAAFELLKPNADSPATDRAELVRRLSADIQAVPKPTQDTPPAEAEAFARMHLLLAQVHLTDVPTGFPKAEQAATTAADALKSFSQIGMAERQALGFGIEETRLRAMLGQAAALFREGRFALLSAKLDKAVAEAAAAGPAVQPGQEPAVAAAAKRLDDFRRNELLVLALKAAIREKKLDRVGQLFDLLKQLGGGADAGVQAVAQLAAGVKPDLDALRREGKADDAAQLAAGVGGLLDKVAGGPGLSAGQRVYLGRALKDLGSYEKAAEVLKAVPAPAADQLAKSPNDLQGDARSAVLLYRGAQLELAETYRLAKNFPAADEVLKPAADPKTGWAKGAPNFRREALMLTEAKAAAASDPPTAQKLWVEALTGWNTLAGEYRALMLRPLPAVPPVPKEPAADAPDVVRKKYEADVKARADAEQKQADAKRQREIVIKPLYFDAFYEVQRCVVKGNSLLLKHDPEKLGRSLDKVADSIRKVEASNPDLSGDLRAKFAGLLTEYPELKKRYDAKKP